MKRILVTGAGGFVGRQVTPLLAAAGFEVHAVASTLEPPPGETIWHRADLLDREQSERVIATARPDGLLHLAWCARPPDYWRSPDNLRWLAASLDLVRLFVEHGGQRIVGVGSCAEYDWRQGYCTEGVTPLLPASLYGVTKAACGSAIEAYAGETGISAAWGRLFFLYGPFDSPVRLVPSLVRSLSAGQPARCATGSHIRDFLHVEEAAAALVALLRSSVSGPVNIASGLPVRIADVARRVALQVGRPDLLTIEPGPSENALVCANVARLRNEVGWNPPAEGIGRLDEVVRWWQSADAIRGRA